ncbi:MAG TPA: phosphate ABC transporter substrate-binding protein PstS [Anaerolineales bacterium]
MFKLFRVIVFGFIAASVLLTACGTAATPTPAAPTQAMPGATQAMPAATQASGAPTPLPAGSVQITAGGATFPYPLYSQWTYAFQLVDPSTVINYQPVGSGGGKANIINGTFDFAGSDSILSAQNYTDGKDLQMYPMVASAVVPAYNIKWNLAAVGAGTPTPAAPKSPLVLDRQTLVDIYDGKVTKWNDPEIVKLNPDLKDVLPAADITTIHRSDGSGTTEIFTNALTAFSPDWTAGAGQSVQWPIKSSLGGKGNPGVAGLLLTTPNSIGYVELAYAVSNNIPFASLVNKAGKTVTANQASIGADMADFANAFDAHLNAKIVDGPGAGSWPITGYTYIILHTQNMQDCVKAEKILEYLQWALTAPIAAQAATKLGYSVLPPEVQKTVLAKLAQVTCNGQPVPMPTTAP